MEKIYFEDYTIGETFISPARTIVEADIHSYAALTGDWHPIHTDVEAAQKSSFGERIAHGMLTFSIGLALPFRLGLYVTAPKSFIAFYGIESLKFVKPCKIGDTIHTEVTVMDLVKKDDKRGIIVYEYQVKNQKSETVLVFTARTLAGRKPLS
ncbi:MAG: dehydratase [Deltaproteobacteria bacterium]|jgi:3-hydroxybutyryl-CoA dehydratase|nr:dehydratase [Deltaproteobacteria bacterium]MBT4640346.1 dehydratase [Deltaproteobacteria bacterium]